MYLDHGGYYGVGECTRVRNQEGYHGVDVCSRVRNQGGYRSEVGGCTSVSNHTILSSGLLGSS